MISGRNLTNSNQNTVLAGMPCYRLRRTLKEDLSGMRSSKRRAIANGPLVCQHADGTQSSTGHITCTYDTVPYELLLA